MKDIKTLYLNAKQSSKSSDLDILIEAAYDAIDNNPSSYVTNLEYIISNPRGLQTIETFKNKYGIPIPHYESFMDVISDSIDKSKRKNIPYKLYEDCLQSLVEYRNNNIYSFAMYENYADNDITGYEDSLYNCDETNIASYMSRYGESCLPDVLTRSVNRNALLNVVIKRNPFNNPTFFEWLDNSLNDFNDINDDIKDTIHNKSLSYAYEAFDNRRSEIIIESLMVQEDPVVEFNDSILEVMQEMFYVKQFQLAFIENKELKDKIDSEMMDLCEQIDMVNELNEDVADNIAPMLPGPSEKPKLIKKQNHINEDTHWMNTSDKKSGKAPDYLKHNHDMGWGEDYGPTKTQDEPYEDSPYSQTSSDNHSYDGPSEYDYDSDESPSQNTGVATTGNSYYYYTYTNSNNKNTNSHNSTRRTNRSHNTDNSTGKTDNRSTTIDNSTHVNQTSSSDNDDDSERNNELLNMNDKEYGESILFENDSPERDPYDNPDDSMDGQPDENIDISKPKSRNPVTDGLQDVDRIVGRKLANVKRAGQDVQLKATAAAKPFKRVFDLITGTIGKFKDMDENRLKEAIVDPKSRSLLYKAARTFIIAGSFYKAGLLYNGPFLLLLGGYTLAKRKDRKRLRNEVYFEMKNEIKLMDEKIKDADAKGDLKAKYQLTRLRRELVKKYLRSSGQRMNKVI